MVGQINKPEITTIQHDKYTDLDEKIHRLKGVFAKNERGYRLSSIKKRF